MMNPDALLDALRSYADQPWHATYEPGEIWPARAKMLIKNLDEAMKQGRVPIEWMRHDIKGDVS